MSNPQQFFIFDSVWNPCDKSILRKIRPLLTKRAREMKVPLTDVQIHWREIPFYADLKIIRVSGLEDENQFAGYYAANDNWDIVAYFDGTSPPIHYLNKEYKLQITKENVKQYLRFFCFFVQADQGSFHIIDSKESGFIAHHEQAMSVVKELPTSLFKHEKEKHWELCATILYGNEFFRVNFTVHPHGEVLMDDDKFLEKVDEDFVPKRFPRLLHPHLKQEDPQTSTDPLDNFLENEISSNEKEECKPRDKREGNTVEVISHKKLHHETLAACPDHKKVLDRLFRKVKPYRGFYPIKTFSESLEKLNVLDNAFPQMQAVTAYLRDSMVFSKTLKQGEIQFPCILLDGPPGTGKSRYIQAVAELFDLPSRTIDFATASAAFVLAGSSRVWKSGQPGIVVETLLESRCANPIMILEELDKVTGKEQYPAINTLYTLLEPNSAKCYTDEYLAIETNCQYINWFATSNSLEGIPEAILSRFQCFHIEAPNSLQRTQIATSVYQSLLEELGVNGNFSSQLSDSVATSIANECSDLRQMRRHIRAAMVRATLRCERLARSRPSALEDISLTCLDLKEVCVNHSHAPLTELVH